MSGSRTQLEAPQGSAKPRREAGPVELIAAQRTAANMLLSVALTAPLYVAKAVSRKPPLPPAGVERRRRRSRASMPETI